MGKIIQFEITRDELIQAIVLKCQLMTDQELSVVTEQFFRVKLNACGSHRGSLFTTNMDRVHDDVLLKFSRAVDVEDLVFQIIKAVKSDTGLSETQARAESSIDLVRKGIFLERSQFDRAFLQVEGGKSDV